VERRDLIRGGLLLGAGLLVEGPAEARRSAPVPAVFFEGLLGGDFEGWVVHLVVTGRRAAGIAYDPATVDRNTPEGEPEELRALRLQGKLTRRSLKMKAYDIEDLRLRRRVGLLSARVEGAGLAGGLRLKDRSRGPFQAMVVEIAKESLNFVGQYRGSIVDPAERTLYTGLLTLAPDLTWELRDMEAAPGFPALTAGSRLTGRWGVKADGSAVLSVTQVPQPRDLRPLQDEVAELKRKEKAGNRAAGRKRPPGAPASLVFEDGDFQDADWSARMIVPDQNGAGAFTARQALFGGNPGAYREITHQGRYGLEVAHLLGGAEYTRGRTEDAPIESLDFTWDFRTPDPPGVSGNATTESLIAFTPEGGETSYYSTGGPSHFEGIWNSFEGGGVLRDFGKVAGPGANVIERDEVGTFRFGFLTRSSNDLSPQLTDLDNFRVEVTLGEGEPPPSRYALSVVGPTVIYPYPFIDTEVTFSAVVSDGAFAIAGVPVTIEQLLTPPAPTPRQSSGATDDDGVFRYRFVVDLDNEVLHAVRATAAMPDGSIQSARLSVYVTNAQGICPALCVLVALLDASAGTTDLAGAGSLRFEHPLLPGHFLCAEPLPKA
jgi:hypothetical protein